MMRLVRMGLRRVTVNAQVRVISDLRQTERARVQDLEDLACYCYCDEIYLCGCAQWHTRYVYSLEGHARDYDMVHVSDALPVYFYAKSGYNDTKPTVYCIFHIPYQSS